MKYYIPLIAAILMLGAASQVFAQKRAKIRIETYQANKEQKAYQHLLIVSHGSLFARTYIEGILMDLKPELKKAKVPYHYEYLGDPAKKDVESTLKTVLNRADYDAVLRILPLTTSQYATTNNYVGSDGIPYSLPGDDRQLSEYTFEITERASGTVIWSARLILDTLQAMKDRSYSKIARTIMQELAENKLVSATASAK